MMIYASNSGSSPAPVNRPSGRKGSIRAGGKGN